MSEILRVYIAGASTELERVERATKLIHNVASGLLVTSTWPDVIKAAGTGNPTDASMEQYRAWTRRDLEELEYADMLWLLLPPLSLHTVGAWVELGFAERAGKPILMSGPHRPIFTVGLAQLHTETDQEMAYELGLLHEDQRNKGRRKPAPWAYTV